MSVEIIAEIGQNHNGDMALAVDLIRQAKRHGADVAKFQVFDARRLFPPRDINPWYDYNCQTELSREDVLTLADECRRTGIEFLASVFDIERIDWLEEAGAARYKVASRSIHDTPLLAALAATGKPLIASLGHWDVPEFPVLPGRPEVSFLHCISDYPARLQDLHLGAVDFQRYAGFSDHTVGLTAARVAMSRGAGIIEKHFTLDQSMIGPDHAGSMTPAELAELNRFRVELAECL